MGQTLSEPVTEKETAHCHNDEYSVGSSCMQGYRIHMEDSHTHILSLPDDPGTSFLAVYDGHGGANIGKYAAKHLHKFIVKRPEYHTDTPEALKKAFLDIDEALLNEEEFKNEMGGSTAVCCLIKDKKLYCVNAGDSRAIACVNGQAIALSLDHKPMLPEEMQRIRESGGWVENSRVNGSLALSRALGDFKFKQNKKVIAERQVVTAYPDVQEHNINEDWQFVLLASDGIWDVMTNDDVVRQCLRKIEMGIPPETICEELMNECLSPDLLMAGTDNMTVVLACFLHNKSYEELSKCAKEINEREQKKTDEMLNAFNDSYPATSADSSEAGDAKFFDDNDDEDEVDDEDEALDEINGDNVSHNDGQFVENGTARTPVIGDEEPAVRTLGKARHLDDALTPPADHATHEKEDAVSVQEGKKHKENDSEEER